jgi:plastocyanin
VTRAVVLAAGIVVAALLGAADGSAGPTQNPKLVANVGPGMEISLRTAGGAAVTRLAPGTYDIDVTDQSEFHNFSLTGPGVSEQTGVETTGTVTWTVTFGNGTYTFRCIAHPTTMRGTFPAGTAPAPVKTITAKTKLVLTSGPAQVITLKTKAGAVVKQMKLGTYTVTVRDRGAIHNAHVRAPGFNRATKPLSYRGTQTWKVALKRTGTFRFLCDPHAILGMKGSAKIVR